MRHRTPKVINQERIFRGCIRGCACASSAGQVGATLASARAVERGQAMLRGFHKWPNNDGDLHGWVQGEHGDSVEGSGCGSQGRCGGGRREVQRFDDGPWSSVRQPLKAQQNGPVIPPLSNSIPLWSPLPHSCPTSPHTFTSGCKTPGGGVQGSTKAFPMANCAPFEGKLAKPFNS